MTELLKIYFQKYQLKRRLSKRFWRRNCTLTMKWKKNEESKFTLTLYKVLRWHCRVQRIDRNSKKFLNDSELKKKAYKNVGRSHLRIVKKKIKEENWKNMHIKNEEIYLTKQNTLLDIMVAKQKRNILEKVESQHFGSEIKKKSIEKKIRKLRKVIRRVLAALGLV